MQCLPQKFFEQDTQVVARALLGKLLRHKVNGLWLECRIIETEAYYLQDKASHASLGYTEKRKALFMSAGTIYMYYARGGDSLNVSCGGAGNAVLIKSGFADTTQRDQFEKMLAQMQMNNPLKHSGKLRTLARLCSGQTLLCKSLQLRVIDWDQKDFVPGQLEIMDMGYTPSKIIQCKRLGIPAGRDEQLLYRFIDFAAVRSCTNNPLTKKKNKLGEDYHIL